MTDDIEGTPLEWLTDGPRMVDVQHLINTIQAVANALLQINTATTDNCTVSYLAGTIVDNIGNVERTLMRGAS